MTQHILEAIKNTTIPQHLVDSIINDCLEVWEKSGVDELVLRAKGLSGKIADETYFNELRKLVIEVSTVCNCILILEEKYNFQSEFKNLIQAKKDEHLFFVKKELTTRTLFVNQKMSKVSGLSKSIIQYRQKEYLSF